MALIEIKNIVKAYPDGTEALRGVSFSIEKGDFVAIMGPSGSGKSTLLHVMGFLDNATQGTYHFDHKTSDDYGKEVLARIRNKRMGFVFQAFNLLPKTTVFDNVKLPLFYSDVPASLRNSLSKDAIDAVGLSHRIDHMSSELSGGEKQRVAIARALVNNPDVIFADEPTGNLDSKSGQIIMAIMEKLNAQGKTIILVTHETYTAENAKRIIHLYDGKIKSDSMVTNRKSAEDNFMK